MAHGLPARLISPPLLVAFLALTPPFDHERWPRNLSMVWAIHPNQPSANTSEALVGHLAPSCIHELYLGSAVSSDLPIL